MVDNQIYRCVHPGVMMGRISKAIEEKKRELMWLKIKFVIKTVAIILVPIALIITIAIIKKKTKKHIKRKIKEKIRNHVQAKHDDVDEFEVDDDTLD